MIEMTIIDKDTLGILVVSAPSDPLRAIVRFLFGNRIGELPARSNVAVEHISQGIAALLAGDAGPHDGDDVRLSEDGLQNDGAGAVHDDDGLLVGGCDGLDEVVAVVPRV